MPTIVFSHANSFPAATYQVLFKSLQARGFHVQAIEKYGHDARYPVSNNWPHVVKQLAEFAQTVAEATGEPVWLAGHSLGGFLSLMAAAQHPGLAQGVVLIDAPLVGGWRAHLLALAKAARWVQRVPPGAVSRKRRHTWPDARTALEHFRRKAVFSRWDSQVLQDYVDNFPINHQDQRVLAFDRDIETAIYNTLPDNLERLLADHPLQCPVSFIGGRQSTEMKIVGMGLTHKITKGRNMMLDGTHLFPMEQPQATAAALEAALLNMTG